MQVQALYSFFPCYLPQWFWDLGNKSQAKRKNPSNPRIQSAGHPMSSWSHTQYDLQASISSGFFLFHITLSKSFSSKVDSVHASIVLVR